MDIIKPVGKKQLQFRIPSKLRKIVKRNSRFIISKSGDALLLKPMPDSVLDAADKKPDSNPLTIEEINAIVHKVRSLNAKKRK